MSRAQAGFHVILLFFTCTDLFQEILAVLTVTVEPRNTPLKVGETLTALCNVNESISSCGWDAIERKKNQELKKGENLTKGIMYYGRGYEHGDCGITILNVTERHNRIFTCQLKVLKQTPHDLLTETTSVLRGEINVVVAKAPKAPQINVIAMYPINITYPKNTFEESKTIQAECKIEFGRPAAGISWYIGTERILHGLDRAKVDDLGPKYGGQERITQNLTRTLKYLDNGKELKCVANHIALGLSTLHHPIFKLDVYFKPKFEDTEKCAFAIGKFGKVVVTIRANPKPTVEWLVGATKIPEGGGDERFHALNLIESEEQATWDAMLNIYEVKSEYVKKNYTLIARNIVGENKSKLEISACPVLSDDITASTTDVPVCPSPSPAVTTCPPTSPEVLACPAPSVDVTAWSIAGTAVTILLIILIKSILNNCRTTGRLCFSKQKTKKMDIKYATEHEIEEAEEMCTDLQL